MCFFVSLHYSVSPYMLKLNLFLFIIQLALLWHYVKSSDFVYYFFPLSDHFYKGLLDLLSA